MNLSKLRYWAAGGLVALLSVCGRHASATDAQTMKTPTVQAETQDLVSSAAAENFANQMQIQPVQLPNGVDKSGVNSQAINVPQGTGKIQGMGESFSAQLSTGIASYNVPFALPKARGATQPSLRLAYSSSLGHGVAGVGWGLGVPYIARQTDRGIPKYNDPSQGGAWHPEQDRFVFGGGQELVPICLVQNGACTGAQQGEVMPVWAEGYQYFRARVEGAFLRFFWSPDHKTWRVQDRTGVAMELGVPLDDATYKNGLEYDPQIPDHVFRWNIVREYDAEGSANPAQGAPAPNNRVIFRYAKTGDIAYLTDIYDTPPSASSSAGLSEYAHHTRLAYEVRSDPLPSYRRGYPTQDNLRLLRVDVASKTMSGNTTDARELVRRYHLAYDANFHPSLLTSVQMEGRCSAQVLEGNNETIPFPSNCPRLPAMTFGYQHVAGYDVNGNPQNAPLAGYEAFDERVQKMSQSPKHSLDDSLTDLFDINADALPDVLVTAPFLYNGNHAVFFNGDGGVADTFSSAQPMKLNAVLGATPSVIALDNPNVVPLDADGDGTIDLLHMPQVKKYAVYAPKFLNGSWTWDGRVVDTAVAQSPKVNFQQNRLDTHVMDVNSDGLVDVVYSAGTEYQTFFGLGRYPGGDGQYGSAIWTSATASQISNDPVAWCEPWAGTPVRFSDGDVRVGDMNGDGLVDIVRIRKGDVKYWPGRGNGFFGTGAIDDCKGGSFAQSRHISMSQSPIFWDPSTDNLRLDDINGDGLDDIVQIRFNAVDIWLNVDGVGFTQLHTMAGAPISSIANRARLVDMNGSGTRDVVWGDGFNYRYVDMSGAVRPWVLTHVENGLGKTTDLDYSTSPKLMLAAEKAGAPWASKAPMVVHVVTKVTEHDNLATVGRPAGDYVTTYEYRDPSFDGRQREFRGFKTARATRVGDANGPTAITESTFLLGECVDEDPNDNIDPCAPADRWRDNGRESLKGLPAVVDTFDTNNAYLSTTHYRYRLRRLYVGVDGREVRQAFDSQTDAWLYDTGPFNSSPQTSTEGEIDRELTLGQPVLDSSRTITVRSTTGTARLRSSVSVDAFGNATDSIANGCITGCATTDEVITTTTVPSRRNDDPTGWMWRTTETYTTGSVHNVQRNHTYVAYDIAGNPTQTTAVLSGTLALDRFHEANANVAPAPPNASADGTITISTQSYDAFGNLIDQRAPNARCRQVQYDNLYGELPTTETVFVGSVDQNTSCGSLQLQGHATYDRGFQLAVAIADLHNEKTALDYDGLGRLTSLFKPDPTSVGSVSPIPSVKLEYFLTQNPSQQPYSLIHTQTQDGTDPTVQSYRHEWGYVDGLGRVMLMIEQADPNAGDAGDWIVSGLTEYDKKNTPRRAFLPWFWSGNPQQFPLNTLPPSKYTTERYDAFGRQLETHGLDGATTLRTVRHGLTVDAWDAADLGIGPHTGTPMTVRRDGHGRTVSAIERLHVGQMIDTHETRASYLPTGEPEVITRAHPNSGDSPVVRWMRYDTLGRMMLNVTPDTTGNFNADPSTDPSQLKAWRYAYDDNGDLVGTSDARGCGSNFHYDTGGRLIAEDYSPCLSNQADYTSPDFTNAKGIEILYRYDVADPDAQNIQNFPIDTTVLAGRLVSVSDRASKTITRYDGRGRVTGMARRVAKPGTPDDDLSLRYAPRWYTQTALFDGADRVKTHSTGASVQELLGQNNESAVSIGYSKRGNTYTVGSSYGDLVTQVTHDADGLVSRVEYGDVAKTTTDFGYDDRRRLQTVQTYRGPPSIWTSPPQSYQPSPNLNGTDKVFQGILEDAEFLYDDVDNPIEIRDWRSSGAWPSGAQPVTRKIEYDDLYRTKRVDYSYSNGDDTWVSPYYSEDQNLSTDPRRAKPSPHVSFDKRVLRETFEYDWLGNTTKTEDDARGFYDRSLGTIGNGTAAAGPHQLKSASGLSSTRDGALNAAYDTAGNLKSLAVVRNGPCLPQGATCSQRFVYDWDEVGRLVRARRWDTASPGNATDPVPNTTPDADLRYGYDAADSRVIKTAVDAQNTQRHTVYVFGSLELRRADFVNGDYVDDKDTEVAYLMARGVRIARLHYAEASLPTLTNGKLHVLFELPDHLGSTSIVVDKETSELVEKSTYMAYGQADSDYRPTRWDGFREDYRFTGKEDDIEVGLHYFGKRFLSSSLNRWISADPLTIHTLSADINPYAYVHGSPLRSVDPFGLQDSEGSGEASESSTTAINPDTGNTMVNVVVDGPTALPGFGSPVLGTGSVNSPYVFGITDMSPQATVANGAPGANGPPAPQGAQSAPTTPLGSATKAVFQAQSGNYSGAALTFGGTALQIMLSINPVTQSAGGVITGCAALQTIRHEGLGAGLQTATRSLPVIGGIIRSKEADKRYEAATTDEEKNVAAADAIFETIMFNVELVGLIETAGGLKGQSALGGGGSPGGGGGKVVYRGGPPTSTNLTPRPIKDTTGPRAGLSVSTIVDEIVDPGGKYQIIDPGRLKDLEVTYTPGPYSPGHHSVVPKDITRLDEWASTRDLLGPTIHPFTRELMDAIIGQGKRK
jgi:RHS repeat-associated protein